MTTWILLCAGATAGFVFVGCDEENGAPRNGMERDASHRDAQDSSDAPFEAEPERDGAIDSPGRITEIATSTDVPWGLAFLPDKSALMAERDSFKVIHIAQGGQTTEVGVVPNVLKGGEGGLLGLAVSANFNADHWVYLFHTSPSDNRIVRMKYENGRLGTHQILLEGIQRAGNHNAGRLRFGPDGMLYACTGDASASSNSQNTASLNGKILRLTADGRIPADNPFPNSYTWAYGLRDPQGLAFDSRGRLWASEFGANRLDELNLIERGGNYGWPRCEGTVASEGSCSEPGLIAPVRTWSTAEASPSGLAIVNDTLYMAALRGERLWVMTIDGNRTTQPAFFLRGTYGRLRTVEASPDGGLWFTTSNRDGRGGARASELAQILHIAL